MLHTREVETVRTLFNGVDIYVNLRGPVRHKVGGGKIRSRAHSQDWLRLRENHPRHVLKCYRLMHRENRLLSSLYLTCGYRSTLFVIYPYHVTGTTSSSNQGTPRTTEMFECLCSCGILIPHSVVIYDATIASVNCADT